jgi:hypothetical protein
MFRWIAILAAIALAGSAAYGQSSSPQTQDQMMGHMDWPMMNDDAVGPDMMPMMQMMQMMQMMGSGNMGPAMMDQDVAGPMCRWQMRSNAMMSAPGSYLEARLAFAKSELAIDISQEPAWQAYVTALRSQVQPMSAHMTNMRNAMMGEADFPGRFDARIALLEGQLSSLKAVRETAIGLYNGLNAEQKKKADRLLPVSLCM